MGEDRENLPHPDISDRKIFFPRLEREEEDGPGCRRILGVLLMLVGSCGCCYITPVPLLAEAPLPGGGMTYLPWAPIAVLILGAISLAFFIPGYLLYQKNKR